MFMQKSRLCGAALLLAAGLAHAGSWSYEGDEGPQNWGKLDPSFAMCETGSNQSPINIEGALSARLPALAMSYGEPGKTIANNGHTVQINFAPGNVLKLDGAKFEMKQVHFHVPSENTINGTSYPLEAHFVHADDKGHLAVIAVMFKVGAANAGLAKLWAEMPAQAGDPVALTARFKPLELMPARKSYYRFNGSLTTPPCSEGVRWLVLKQPISASKAQIEAFEHVMHHHTNRPVQPLNARVIVD